MAARKTHQHRAPRWRIARRPISLGRAHRLLEEDQLQVAAIAGTSAGANERRRLTPMAGKVAAARKVSRQGLSVSGARIGRKGRFGPVQRTPWDLLNRKLVDRELASFLWFDAMSPCGVALRPPPHPWPTLYKDNPLAERGATAKIDLRQGEPLRRPQALHLGNQCRGPTMRTSSTGSDGRRALIASSLVHHRGIPS